MSGFALDTNVASILFKPDHALITECRRLVGDSELVLPFMALAELLLWPKANRWGSRRVGELQEHIKGFRVIFPDARTCEIWSSVVAGCRRIGRPIDTADAWIAATAIQWQLPLVTTNYDDFECVPDLNLIKIG